MLDLDKLSPAQYRTRYETLQAQARSRAAAPRPVAEFTEIPAAHTIDSGTLPPGAYVYLRLARGTSFRIINESGTPGAAFLVWNADDTSERYNSGDTVKLQWTTRLTTGCVLFSDMGRILASIVADSGAGHDTIIGPNSPAQTSGQNGRDNLRNAAAKFGMSGRDVASALSLFSPVAVDQKGRMRWQGTPPAGAMIELRAEMNLLVALSNTPHALSPQQQATGPISYVAWRTPAGAENLCRNFCQEAVRGFINTDKVFIQ